MPTPLLMVGVPTVLTTNTTTALPASSTLISFQSAAGSTIEASNDGVTWGTLAVSAANVVVSVFTAAVFIRTATANTTVTAKTTTTRSQSQFLAGNGSAAAPSYSFLGDSTTGWFRTFAGMIGISNLGVETVIFSPSVNGGVRIGSTTPLGWSSLVDPFAAANDTGLSRGTAGQVLIGNGTFGDFSGSVKANTVWARLLLAIGASGTLISAPADGQYVLANGGNTIGSTVKVDALPTIASGFGVGAAITPGSTPFAGSINIGTGGTANTGNINFNGTAFPSAPFAVVTNAISSAVPSQAISSTTQLNIFASSPWVANQVISWICVSPK